MDQIGIRLGIGDAAARSARTLAAAAALQRRTPCLRCHSCTAPFADCCLTRPLPFLLRRPSSRAYQHSRTAAAAATYGIAVRATPYRGWIFLCRAFLPSAYLSHIVHLSCYVLPTTLLHTAACSPGCGCLTRLSAIAYNAGCFLSFAPVLPSFRSSAATCAVSLLRSQPLPLLCLHAYLYGCYIFSLPYFLLCLCLYLRGFLLCYMPVGERR